MNITDACCRSNCICICICCKFDDCGAPRLTPDNCDNNSAIGSTASRPDGDRAEKPVVELKCIFDLRERGPPKALFECGILRIPPCLIADGSSYSC